MDILVVDEDVGAAESISSCVESWGYRVDTTGSGTGAIEMLRKKRFDLVLLDLFPPDCDGVELIPQLKEIRRGLGVMGIITMTGRNSRELELRVRQEGVDCYMIKPVKMKDLKEILDHNSKKTKERG